MESVLELSYGFKAIDDENRHELHVYDEVGNLAFTASKGTPLSGLQPMVIIYRNALFKGYERGRSHYARDLRNMLGIES